uniref:Uncharacterized protein n=1 Tax=Ditylum brightwellii TaxID=49249 RepID=A0A7S1YS43_9STRA
MMTSGTPTSVVISSNNLTDVTDCNADATGLIGSISSSDNIYIIEYTYEIETLSNVSVSNTTAPIENAISDVLLSLFFPACNEGRLLQEDIFGVAAISARPLDEIQDDAFCEVENINDNNDCNVVKGALTIWTRPDIYSSVMNSVLGTIQDAMGDGDLLGASPGIVRITYIDELVNTPIQDGDPPLMDTMSILDEEPAASNFSVGITAIVSSFAAVGVLVTVVLRHRRKTDDDNEGLDVEMSERDESESDIEPSYYEDSNYYPSVDNESDFEDQEFDESYSEESFSEHTYSEQSESEQSAFDQSDYSM